ncbi:MAG TPA: M48 family metalloprotease, partial [Longimicrobiales bacterium]
MRLSRLVPARITAPLLAVALAACATNPVTGKRELVLISEQQEIQMGQESAAQVAQSIGLVQDQALQDYVQRVGLSLARVSQRPNLPWQFRVVDDPTPNAFALPGGFIFVTRGLMSMMTNEAELATVVGHEIGHVTARHSVRAMTRSELAQVGLVVGSVISPTVARYGQLASSGMQLLLLKYDRAAEAQADELGFGYALADHYDVRRMADVFTTLQRVSAKEGQSPLPSWLETHPSEPDRIAKVNQRVAALSDTALRNALVRRPEYMRQVDSLVYGVNPRSGFFQGTHFIHPDLRFQITFPEGWQTQNTAQTVAAASPQKDAVMELSLADSGSADQAYRALAGAQGVTVSSSGSQSIGGQRAVSAIFQAQTDQGLLDGVAAFIDYGGHTYRVLGYTPAQAFGQYRGALERAATSFAPLTDPTLLSVQPRRLRVVTTDRAMTLAEFNTRYPSTVSLDDLAIINEV